jgi:hypothetical protein
LKFEVFPTSPHPKFFARSGIANTLPRVNTDVFAVLLVVLITLAVTTGTVMSILISRSRKLRPRMAHTIELPPSGNFSFEAQPAPFLNRPTSWLAIKSRNLIAVQCALGLHHVKPCSLLEGLAGQEKLFIAPPLAGWVLAFGSGLPDPGDDVDICFRFITSLSRKLGTVQFFTANRALGHHAWVRAEGGRIVRGYAWAGRTLWQQGPRTQAEIELDLHCFEYDDADAPTPFIFSDIMSANVDRVPLLAARWSLDPAAIDQSVLAREYGLAGEPSRAY